MKKVNKYSNRLDVVKLIVLISVGTLFSCGTKEKESNTCGEGDALYYMAHDYCVYKAAITETGFQCPAEFSNRQDFEGGTVCGEDSVSKADAKIIGDKAKKKWVNNDAGTGTQDCEGLSEEICKTTTGCEAISGAKFGKNFCLEDTSFAGCGKSGQGENNSVLVMSKDPNGDCWSIGTSGDPVPDGWGHCFLDEEIEECSSVESVDQKTTFTECEDIAKTTDYCAAERLNWKYVAATQTLTLTNERVMLNCCGNRRVRATKNKKNGSITMWTIDSVDKVEDRCRCMCVFEYGVEIPNIKSGSQNVVLFEKIDNKMERKWRGSIEIPKADGEGDIEINTDDATIACVK